MVKAEIIEIFPAERKASRRKEGFARIFETGETMEFKSSIRSAKKGSIVIGTVAREKNKKILRNIRKL